MKYNKTITLKDGRECTLRSCTESDGRAALDNFILTHSQTDFLLTYPDEITFTADKEGKYLQKKADSENEVEIIAVVDGRLAGTAGIDALGDKYKLHHRCEFGVSVDKAYWGLGIGRALLSACVECAKKAGYAQVELQVAAENERAIELYRSAGFVEFGRNPKGFALRTSGYMELAYMRLELD